MPSGGPRPDTGGARRGAGRPPGSAGKRTKDVQERFAARRCDPISGTATIAMNKKMAPGIESVYLMTSLEYLYVSASRIREVTSLGRDPSEFVPEHVAAALRHKFGDR